MIQRDEMIPMLLDVCPGFHYDTISLNDLELRLTHASLPPSSPNASVSLCPRALYREVRRGSRPTPYFTQE